MGAGCGPKQFGTSTAISRRKTAPAGGGDKTAASSPSSGLPVRAERLEILAQLLAGDPVCAAPPLRSKARVISPSETVSWNAGSTYGPDRQHEIGRRAVLTVADDRRLEVGGVPPGRRVPRRTSPNARATSVRASRPGRRGRCATDCGWRRAACSHGPTRAANRGRSPASRVTYSPKRRAGSGRARTRSVRRSTRREGQDRVGGNHHVAPVASRRGTEPRADPPVQLAAQPDQVVPRGRTGPSGR
jgi:hypothetical protein